MTRLGRILTITALLSLAAGPGTTRADAVLIDLTDDQVEAAIAQGRETYERYRKERRPIDDLDPEYVIDRGDGGRALLFTEYASIVLETRRYLAIGRRFSREDLIPTLAPLRGRVEFIIVAYGDSRDFLRESKVTLTDAKTRHDPKIWHVNRGLPKTGAPAPYIASGRYSFDARDIDTTTPAVLLLETAEGRAFRFEFDLRALR